MIDLRSDTVTRPSVAMRRAMADAEVGDDVYGEDRTAQQLEERSADLLGMEAALFVPSGTMANQIALMLHCRPGDEVICGKGAHVYYYESSAWAGVRFAEVGTTGLFTADEMLAAVNPDPHAVGRTMLVTLENTHNRAGGRVFPDADTQAITSAAHARNLAVHLDGARLWNAAIATGLSYPRLAHGSDTVSLCFSKGLGAPVGSVLVGTKALIRDARRIRRMFGGGMRQVGVLCAGALHALDHNLPRLGEDHEKAQILARGLSQVPGVTCDPASVESNIVNFDVATLPAATVVSRARDAGVLVNALSPTRIRAVTHLDVRVDQMPAAVAAFEQVLS